MMREQFNKSFDAKAIYDIAGRHQRNGRFAFAETAYKNGIWQYPEDEKLFLGLGNLYRNLGRDDEAMACFKTAYDLAPDNHRTIMAYANFLAAKDRSSESESLYARLSSIEIINAQDYCDIAGDYRFARNYERAEKTFKDGIAHYPADAKLRMGLGSLYRDQRRDAEALECYKQAFAIAPDEQRTIMAYANFLATKQKFADAEKMYARMFSINGETDMRLLCAMGNMYQASNRREQAAACFGRATQLPTADAYANQRYDEIRRDYKIEFMPSAWELVKERMDELAPPRTSAPDLSKTAQSLAGINRLLSDGKRRKSATLNLCQP